MADGSVFYEVRLDIPNRSLYAPDIFESFNHPLVPRLSNDRERRVFVVFMDTTMEGMKKAFRVESKVKIDYGNLDALTERGTL